MNNKILSDTWGTLRASAVTGLTTLFGMQMLRLLFASLVGFLRDSQGMSSLNLAPIALGIFALAFLAGLFRRVLGLHGSLWLTAGGLAVVRFIEQFSTSPMLDFILAAIGVALFLLYIPIATGIARTRSEGHGSSLGAAVLLGVALDTAILVGSRTLDLTWQPGFLPLMLVALLCLALLVSLRYDLAALDISTPQDGTWRSNLPLIAFGPWLLLQLLVFQNLARFSALTGLETPLAGGLVVLGNAIALAAGIWTVRGSGRLFPITVIAALLLVGSLIIAEPTGLVAILLLFVGQVSCALLILVIFSRIDQEAGKQGLARTAVCYGIGQVLFVLLTFLYYVAYDISLGFTAQMLLPVSAFLVSLLALLASLARGETGEAGLGYGPATLAGILLIVPIILAFTWSSTAAIQPDPSNRSLRVMTYNLHNGFNTDGRLDMEALAKVIESSGAEVVAFQEISRGWLIWGGMDMLSWLSQRLDMPFISGPTADAQWGNAILSRYPIVDFQLVSLPPDDLLLLRGYILAEIDVGAGTVAMMATHYYHVSDGTEIRQIQSSAILSDLPAGIPLIMLGDLNATPESKEMRMLAEAGLVDISAAIGTPPTYTYYAASPDHQIDYIWITPDLSASDFEIFQTTASDHLPLVTTVHLP